MSQRAYHGVLVEAGGTVSNNAGASITGRNTGVFFKNQAGTVTNAGNISGTGTQGTGVYLENNGNITNTSTGTITGQIFGAFIEGGFGTLANYGKHFGRGLRRCRSRPRRHRDERRRRLPLRACSTGIYVKYRASGTVTNSGTVSANRGQERGHRSRRWRQVTNNSTRHDQGNAIRRLRREHGGYGLGRLPRSRTPGTSRARIADGVDLAKGGIGHQSRRRNDHGRQQRRLCEHRERRAPSPTAATSPRTGTSGAGVDLGGGGSVTNNSGGSISGGGFGVFATGAWAR